MQVAATRELTKLHEEVVVGRPAEVAERLGEPRGEFTVVVSGLSGREATAAVDVEALVAIARRSGLSDRSTADLLRATGVPRREAYRVVQESGKRSVRKP
jgi:16S rRNA (cytidine1402-2'-O)-methyltransferase